MSYCAKHTQKHGNIHTYTHTDSDDYSIVAFCKNATFITKVKYRITVPYAAARRCTKNYAHKSSKR